MSEKLLYLNRETELEASNYSACIEFIRQRLVSVVEEDVRKVNDSKPIHVTSFSKNANIKDSVERLLKLCDKDTDLLLVTYGPHVQKTLSIIEIFKSSITDKKSLHQFNKLDTLTSIKPGRNELLDSRVNVPILTVLFTHADKNVISGFTKQS